MGYTTEFARGDDAPDAFPDRDRIEAAVQHAQTAFWAAIAERFPEVTTGDFGPTETFTLDEALTTAVETWLANNHPRAEEVGA